MRPLYNLTAMTGKEASASRTVVIGTVELNYRVWVIIGWSTPLGLLATAFAWPLIGQYALLITPIAPAVALWLVHTRSSKGLRLRRYEAMWDQRKYTPGMFTLCGRPLKVTSTGLLRLVENTAPYAPTRLQARPHQTVNAPDVVVTAPARDVFDLFGATT